MAEHQASFTWGAGPQSVYIAGGFNDWSATATPLIKQPDGSFQVKVPVPWGSKQAYKYIVDGEWMVREDEQKEYDAARNHNNIYIAPEGPSSTSGTATGALTSGAATGTGAAGAAGAGTTATSDLASREPGSPIKELAGDAPATTTTTTSGSGSGIAAGVAGAASAAAGALGLGAYAAHKNDKDQTVDDGKPLEVGASAATATGDVTSRAAGTTTGAATTGATTGTTTSGAAVPSGQFAATGQGEPGAPIKELAGEAAPAGQSEHANTSSSGGIAGGAAALAGAAAGALGLGAYAAKSSEQDKDSARLGAGLHTGEPGATPFVSTPTGQQPGQGTASTGTFATTGPADGTTGNELGGPKVTTATPATGTESAFSGGMPNLTGSGNEPAVPGSATGTAGSGLSAVGPAGQFNTTVAEAKDRHNDPRGGFGAGTAAAAGAGAAALGAGAYAASRDHDKATTDRDQMGQTTSGGAPGQSFSTDRSATDRSATGLSSTGPSSTGPTAIGATTTGPTTTGHDAARAPGQAAVAHGQSFASTDASRQTDHTRSTTAPDIPEKSTMRSSGPGAGALAAAGAGAAALGAGAYAATRGDDDDHLSKGDSAKIQAQALYADSTKSAQAQPTVTGPAASSQAPAGHGSPLDRSQPGDFAGHTTQGITAAQADRDRFGAADRGEYSSKVSDYLGKEKEDPPSGFSAAAAAAKKEWTEERAEGHGVGESAIAAGTAGAAALGYGKHEGGKFSAPLPQAPMAAGATGTGAPGQSFAATGAGEKAQGAAGQEQEGISGKALALGAGAAGALGAAGASLYALTGGKPEPISIEEAKARGIDPSTLSTQNLSQAGSGGQPPEGAVQDLQEIVDGLKKDGTTGATGAGVGAVDSARSTAAVPSSTGQSGSGISGPGLAGAAAGAGALGAAAAGAASLLHKDTDFVALILGHPAKGVTESSGAGPSGILGSAGPAAPSGATAGAPGATTGAPGATAAPGAQALDKSGSFATGAPGTAPGATETREGQDQGHGFGAGAAAAAGAGAAALGAGAYAASRKDKDGRDIDTESRDKDSRGISIQSRDLATDTGAAGVPAGTQSFTAQPGTGADRSGPVQTGAYSSKVSEYVNQTAGASGPGSTATATATATGIPGQTSGPGAANIAQSQSFATGAPSDEKDLAARDAESRSGLGAGALAGAGALGAAALGAGAYAATRDKDGADIPTGTTGVSAPGQGQQFSTTGSADATRGALGAAGPGAATPSAIPEAKASQLLAASVPGVVTATEEGRVSGQSTDNEGSEGGGKTKTDAQRARDKAKKARQKAKKRAAATGGGEDDDQTDITSVSNSGYVTPNVLGESDAEGAARGSSGFGAGAVAGGLGAAGLGAGAVAALAQHRDSTASTRAIAPDTPREGLGVPFTDVAPKDATSFDSSVDDRGFASSTTAQDVEKEYKQFEGQPSSQNRERELAGAGLGADTIQGRDTLATGQHESHTGRNATLGGAAGLGAGAAAVGAASALHKDDDRKVSDLSGARGASLPEDRDVAGSLPEGRDFAAGGQPGLAVPGGEYASAGPATGTTGTPDTSRELPTDRERSSGYGTALGAGAAGLGAAALGAGAYAASRRDGDKDGIPATDSFAADYPTYGTASGIGLGTTGTAATGQAHRGAPGHHESIGAPGSHEPSESTKGSSSVGRIVSPSSTGPVRDASGSPLTDTRDLAAATGHPGATSSPRTSPRAGTTQLAAGVPAEVKDTFGDSARRDATGTGHAYGTGVGAPEKETKDQATDDRHGSGLGAAALGAGAAGAAALGAGAYAASRRAAQGQDKRDSSGTGLGANLASQPGVPAASPGEFARGQSQSQYQPEQRARAGDHADDGKYSAKVDEYLAGAPGTKQHREAESGGKYSSGVEQYVSGREVGSEGKDALSGTQGFSTSSPTDAGREGHGFGTGAAAAGVGAAALGTGAYAASRGKDTSASYEQREAESSGKYSSNVAQYVSGGDVSGREGKDALSGTQGFSPTGPTDAGRDSRDVGEVPGREGKDAISGARDFSSTGPTDAGREGHGYGAGAAAAAGAGTAALGAGAYAASRGKDDSSSYDTESGGKYSSGIPQYGGEGKDAISSAQGFSTTGSTRAAQDDKYSTKVGEYLAGAPGTRQHREAESSGKYSSGVEQYVSGREGKDAGFSTTGSTDAGRDGREGHSYGAGAAAAAGAGAAALGAGAYAASRGKDDTSASYDRQREVESGDKYSSGNTQYGGVGKDAQGFSTTGPTGARAAQDDKYSTKVDEYLAGAPGTRQHREAESSGKYSSGVAQYVSGSEGKDALSGSQRFSTADATRDGHGLGAGAATAGVGAAALGAGAYAASRGRDDTAPYDKTQRGQGLQGPDQQRVPAGAQSFATTGPAGVSETGRDSLPAGAGVSGPTAGVGSRTTDSFGRDSIPTGAGASGPTAGVTTDRLATTGANIPTGQAGQDSQFADTPRDTDSRGSGFGAAALGAGATGAAALGAGAYAVSRRDDKTNEFGSAPGQQPHSDVGTGGALGDASRDAKPFDHPTAGGVPTTGAVPGSNFSTTGPDAAGITTSGVPSSTTDFARTATPGTSTSPPPVDKAAERATDASSQDASGFAKPALAAAAGLGAVGAGGAILANKLDKDVQKFQGTDEQGRPVYAALAQQSSPTGEVTAIAGAASGKDYEERMTMERVTGPGVGESRTLMADEVRTAKGTGMTAVEQVEYPGHTQTLIAQQDPSGEITTTLAQTGPQGTTIQRTNEAPFQPVSGPDQIGGPPGAGTPMNRSAGGSVDSYDTALSGDHFDNERTPTIPQNEQKTGSGVSPAAYGAGAAAAGLAAVGAGAAYAHSKNQQPQTQQFQQQSQAGQFIQPSQQQPGQQAQQGQYAQQPTIDTGLHPGQIAGQRTHTSQAQGDYDSAVGAGKGGSAFIEPSPSKYTSGGLPHPQSQSQTGQATTFTSGAGTSAGIGAATGAAAAGLAGRDGDSRQHPSVRGDSSVSAADTSAPLSMAEAREGVQLGPGPEASSRDQRHSSQTFGAPDSLDRQDKSGSGYAAPIAAGVGAVGAGAAAAGLYGASHGQADVVPEQNVRRASNREAFVSGVPTQAKSGNFLAGVPDVSEGQQASYGQQVRGYGDQATAAGQGLSQQGQGFVGQAGQQAQGYTDKAGQFVSSPSGATAPGEKDGKSGLPLGGIAAGVGAAALGAGAAAAHYGAGGRDQAQTKLEGAAPGQTGAGSVPPPAPVDAPTPTSEAPKTPTKERRRSSLFGSMFKKKDRERLQNMETESMPQDAATTQAAARAKLESSPGGPAGSGLPSTSASAPADAQGNRVSGLPGTAGAAGAGVLAAGTGLAAGALATGKSGVDSGSNTLTSGIDAGRTGVTNGLDSGRNTLTGGFDSGRTATTGAFDSGRNTLTGGLDSGRTAATGALGGVTGAVGGAGSKLGMGPESGRTGGPGGPGVVNSAAGFAQQTMDSATGLGASTMGTASGIGGSAGRDSTGKVLDAGAKHTSLLPGTGAGVAGVRASTPTGSRLSAPPGSVGPSTPSKTPRVPEPTTPAGHSTHTTESGRRKKKGLFQRIKEALTGKKHDHERL